MTTKKLLALFLFAITMASAARGETICSGRSASVKLDLRTGVRTTSGEPETIVYDAAWYAGGATVRIEGLGTTPLTGTAGVGTWTPSLCKHHLFLQAFNASGGVVGSEMADFVLEHILVETKAAKAATCTDDGWTAEIACARCGETLQNSERVPALGGQHVGVVTKPAVVPTESGEGATEEISCSRCGALLQPQWTYSVSGGAATVRGVDPARGAVAVPSTLGGCPVIAIGDGAFASCDELTAVMIPDGVTNIEGWAFQGCQGLISVTIPNSVTNIGDNAFQWCDELASISIPASVAHIGVSPFFGCPKLTSVQVAPGNPVFDSREGCNAIVRTADNVLVAGCPGSTIPDSVTAIGDGAFASCSGPSITIPSSVTSIGSEAFRESDLTSVTIPNSVTNVGDRAFKWCQELESVVIPASVTNIGEESFEGCAALTSIRVSPDNPFYDSREDCNAIIRTSDNVLLVGCCETTIPESVTGIGSCAFGECWMNLTSLVIPDGVTFIGDHAFYGCDQLVSVTIPDSVTAIGAGAFSACMSLASVTVPAGVTSIGDGAFSRCSGLAELRLPRRFENQMEGMGVPDGCNVVFYDCFRLSVTSEHGTPAPAFSSGWAPGNVSLVCRVSSPVPDSNNEDVRYVCSGWKGTGSVPATGTGTNCTFALTKDSTLAWQWNRSVRIRLSVGREASSTFADGWCDGPGPAVIPFDAPAGLLHCTLSGDADGVTVDQAARTVSVPTDRPRSVALRVESVGGAVATDGKAVDYATGGEAPWFPVSETTCADGRCLRSGVVGAGEMSVLETTVAGPGRISFRWKALCSRGDYCRFLVDGEPAASISRLASAWATVEMDLGEGEHVLGWSWEKSASAASGENGSFLDDVRWRPRVALAVLCAEGASSPAAGTTEFLYGDLVAASVSEPAPSNGVQCACTGWTGTGSVPENGTGTNVVFTVTEDSTLAWNWRTNVWLSLSCDGMVLASLSGEWAERGRTNLVFYEPLTAYHTLSLSGDTDGVVWDRDAKTLAVPADRPRDLALALETLTLSSVLDAAGLRWVTSGASGWTPEAGTAADGGNAARSGGVATGEESILSSTLSGPGTLSWSWRLDADGVLGVDVELDGAYALSLETPGAWETGSLVVEGEGDHVVRFVFWNEDPDCTDRTECAWLDGVSWSGEVPETAVAATASTPVPVPHAWLSETAPAALSRAGGDFEAAAAATAANGRPVWQCFVAGLDPEDPEAEFRACIAISNGVPVVTFAPDLGNARRYVVEGRETLDGGDWGPTNAASRFFRVRATMPDGWTPSGTTPDGFPGVVTLAFNANGGTVAESSRAYASPGVVGNLPEPVRSGHLFNDWHSRREGGVRFDASTPLPWRDFILYAQWTPNRYTIHFNGNGGTGEMQDLECIYDETVALSGCAFSGPGGAAFLGWSTTADGLVEFADEERISNLSSVDGDIVTLYAKWNRGSFTVHFDANGGTGEMPDQAFTLDVPQNLATNAFSKPNHAFAGWATNENGNVVFGNGAMVHNLATAEATVTLWAVWERYMVVNLSGGSSATSYPVTYLTEPPEGGFNTDDYKTTKLVLRRLEPGPVPTRDATLTKPFYVGLFEVTQKQWELVMGSSPSYFSGDKRPVECVSYNAIRGSSLGSQWPTSNAVDADSFLGKLRARTGIDFDLPTEAQWEYACRAGTTTTYSYGDSEDGNYMWYSDNSSSQTHEVGTKQPNAWGLYDIHGNVREWCLDWTGGSLSGNDPVGSSSGSMRVFRGGHWDSFASHCASSYRFDIHPSYSDRGSGFRLVRILSN